MSCDKLWKSSTLFGRECTSSSGKQCEIIGNVCCSWINSGVRCRREMKSCIVGGCCLLIHPGCLHLSFLVPTHVNLFNLNVYSLLIHAVYFTSSSSVYLLSFVKVSVALSLQPHRHGFVCLNFSFPVWGVYPIPCSGAQHTSNTKLLLEKEREEEEERKRQAEDMLKAYSSENDG